MTTLTAEEIEWQRDGDRCTLEEIDKAVTAAARLLAQVRALGTAAAPLADAKDLYVRGIGYDLGQPGEKVEADYGLPESAIVTLAGSWREPVRELLAAVDATDAALARYMNRAEEDRAQVEQRLNRG